MNENEKLIKRVRERHKLMVDADRENRDSAIADIKFVNLPGAQWDDNMKQERGDRPCYEFNKLRINGKKVINEIRGNRPSGKVRGVEGGDIETAEIFEGLIRNISNISDMDTIVDYAAQYQVDGGMGAWRVSVDYASPMSFDQDITIEPIHNPFCLYADPSAKDILKRDARDWILTEKISKDSFKERWPKAKPEPFENTEFDDDEDWEDENQIRIGEYWYKKQDEKEIWQLQDGKVIDSTAEGSADIAQALIVKRKTVKYDKIMSCILSGKAVLDKPTEWAGSMFPFIMIFGEYIVIEGKTYWAGLHRFSKDAQRSYNVSRTAIAESIAMAPQAKWWATVEQAKGHTSEWAEAHRKNFPYLLFNADPKQSGAPQRMGGADVPIALIQESQLASQEIDATQGIFGDDRGQQTQAQSGRAIYARQEQGRVATFNFPDNVTKGVLRTYEILIDLIPKIIDTERTVRILGADGSEDYKKVNTFVQDSETGEMVALNDLNEGRYDVTVTSGPSFSTKRQEASEIYTQLTQGNPDIFPLIGDLIFKSMDLPYADDIAERLKTMLPPQIQQLLDKGNDVSPEAQAAMQQAEQAMQQVQQMMQEAEASKSEAQTDKAQVDTAIANLRTEEAQFQAKIAQELAKVAQKEAAFVQKEIQSNLDEFNEKKEDFFSQDKELFTEQMAQSIQSINEMAQQFAMQAADVLKEIKDTKNLPMES